MRLDPRAQCDSTRGPSGIRPEGPVGLDQRAQWDSTRGPSGIRLFNRLLTHRDSRTQWDSPIGSPVFPVGFDPRAPCDSTRGPSGTRPEGPSHSTAKAPIKPAKPPIGRAIGLMRAKASSSAFGRLTLAPFPANFGPHWPYWKPNFGPH